MSTTGHCRPNSPMVQRKLPQQNDDSRLSLLWHQKHRTNMLGVADIFSQRMRLGTSSSLNARLAVSKAAASSFLHTSACLVSDPSWSSTGNLQDQFLSLVAGASSPDTVPCSWQAQMVAWSHQDLPMPAGPVQHMSVSCKSLKACYHQGNHRYVKAHRCLGSCAHLL